MNFIEEKGDLFDVGHEYALAHCVGADFVMGRGIAVQFKKLYGNQKWLINNCKGVGTCLLLPKPMINRNVFYLVTKPYSKTSKPTYEDIENSIIDMFKQANDLKINKIAMPKIACGLDGKDWNNIKEIIKRNKPADIEIMVKFY